MDVGIAHMLQETDRLSAPPAGVTVHIQYSIFIFGYFFYFVKLLQGHILTAGDMPFPVLLGGTHIQKDSTRCVLKFLHTLVDIRLFEKIENTHIVRLLCKVIRKPFLRASC